MEAGPTHHHSQPSLPRLLVLETQAQPPAKGGGRLGRTYRLALVPHTLGLPRVETPPCASAKLLGEPERTLPRAERAQGDHFQGLSCMLTWPYAPLFGR